MNRSLHPFSLALGIVFCAVALLSMGQIAIPRGAAVEVGPLPRDMVQVQEGQPFTVPVGTVFVLTALGTNSAGSSADLVTLSIDGVEAARADTWVNSSAAPLSVATVPLGRSAGAGSVVTVSTNNPTLRAQAWGYLDRGTAAGLSRVPYVPRGSDLVQIPEGSPYVVPPGKLLVLTALGSTSGGETGSDQHGVRVNGQLMMVGADPAPFAQPPVAEVPQGFTVQPGATVDVIVTSGSTADGVVWGYLAPQ